MEEEYGPGCSEKVKLSHLLKLCRQGKRDLVQEFLSDHPHFLNMKDNRDSEMMAPVHACCINGHYHCLKLLLQLNVDISVVDMKGRTPFHISCMLGNFKMAKLLNTKGECVSDQDFAGNTGLRLALESPDRTYAMIKFLLEAGSDTCQVDNVGVTPHNIIEKQFEQHATDENRRVLKIMEKYLPIYVDEDLLLKDASTFSFGFGIAMGMVMKKQRYKRKKEAARREKQKQLEFQREEERRARPEVVRKAMFEHMSMMKKRRDYRTKTMKYVFPEESDLSSLSFNESKVSKKEEDDVKEVVTNAAVYDSNGRRITKYM